MYTLYTKNKYYVRFRNIYKLDKVAIHKHLRLENKHIRGSNCYPGNSIISGSVLYRCTQAVELIILVK